VHLLQKLRVKTKAKPISENIGVQRTETIAYVNMSEARAVTELLLSWADFRIRPGSPNYGPRAKSCPRNYFIYL